MKRAIKLPHFIQNGMIIQRDKNIRLWGDASANSTVSVRISGTNLAQTPVETADETKTDSDGHFTFSLPSLPASRDCTLTFTCNGESVSYNDILVGDVWLASGQSNMELYLKYDRDWDRVHRLFSNPDIRIYNVPQVAFEGHVTHGPASYGKWLKPRDEGFEYSTAAGYSFALEIQAAIGVPVGIIGCYWGGSTASAWVPEHVLKKAPLDNYFKEYDDAVKGIDPEVLREESLKGWAFEDSAKHGADFEPLLYGRDRDWQLQYMKDHAGEPCIPMGPYNINRPCGLYHHMLSTLIPYSIKGVIWYQGESDCGGRAAYYDKLMTALIEDWREEWSDNFPFIFVQLAPFGKWLDCTSVDYKVVREKQEYVSKTVPDTYMASIMDIGSYYDIHPKLKMEVGRRLALLARGHVYNDSALLCDSPEFKDAYLDKNNRIVISFEHADSLHISGTGTDIALRYNDNEIISLNDVVAVSDELIVSLPTSIAPKAGDTLELMVGWDDFAQIFIHNRNGLPIKPFKTSITI